MSRKPGIGHTWFQTWHTDIYKATTSNVRVRGHAAQPPRYYDKLYQRLNPQHYAIIKQHRKEITEQKVRNNMPDRLRAEERITEHKIQSLRQRIDQ